MEGRRRFFGPAASRVACAHVDHDLHVWDLRAGALQLRLSGHWGDLSAGAFESDVASPRLASAGAEGTLRIWSLEDGLQTHELVLGDRIVLALRFRAGQVRLVTDDGAILTWSLDAPPTPEHAPGAGEPVRCATFGGEAVWWGRGPGFGRHDRTPQAPRAILLDADERGVAFASPSQVGMRERGATAPSWLHPQSVTEVRLTADAVWTADTYHVVAYERSSGEVRERFDAPGRVDDLLLVGGEGADPREIWARVDGGASLVEVRTGRRLEPRGLEGRGNPLREVTRFRLDRVLGASGFAVPEFRPQPPPAISFRDVDVKDAPAADEPAAPARDERWARIAEVLRKVRDRLRHPVGRGYRDQARTVDLHKSGAELELVLGEVRVRLRLTPDKRGVRVVLVGTRGDTSAPPTTAVRLARWVRRRQGRREDDALVARVRATAGARDVRLARSGPSVSLAAQLRSLPSSSTLTEWVEAMAGRV